MQPIEDPQKLHDALGAFATSVTVITSIDPGGEVAGFTANSFSSVSLDPPLILFSLSKEAQCLQAFLSASHFAVNVLGEDHEHLSDHFATSKADKWSDVEYETSTSGCPILSEALASFECEYHYKYDGGDHVIFVGEVERMERREGDRPLVYFGGGYRRLHPGSES